MLLSRTIECNRVRLYINCKRTIFLKGLFWILLYLFLSFMAFYLEFWASFKDENFFVGVHHKAMLCLKYHCWKNIKKKISVDQLIFSNKNTYCLTFLFFFFGEFGCKLKTLLWGKTIPRKNVLQWTWGFGSELILRIKFPLSFSCRPVEWFSFYIGIHRIFFHGMNDL